MEGRLRVAAWGEPAGSFGGSFEQSGIPAPFDLLRKECIRPFLLGPDLEGRRNAMGTDRADGITLPIIDQSFRRPCWRVSGVSMSV